MNQELCKKIEAILFVSGEPLSVTKLSKILNAEKGEIEASLSLLEKNLSDHGIVLSKKGDEYLLVSSPDVAGTVDEYMKEDLDEDLSKAALETLAVIVYKGPITRSEIDYIRGVNSAFTVRNLMVRGIVERKADPKDARSWLYSPSFEFLKFAGIDRIEKLEGFEEFKKETEELLNSKNKTEER